MSEKNTKAEAICESDETHELKELIRDLMSDSNDKRSDAKSILEICINRRDPHVFANKLYRVLSSSLDPKSRTISAILLRKSFIIKSYVRFSSFPVETQSTLKRDLLKLVDTPATPINKELCHTVSALAASLLPKKEWPEFLSFLFKLVESDKNRALLIVTYLAQYLGKGLNKLHLDKELHSVLLQCLKTTTEGEDVRITVLGAAINFILCLEQKDLVNFQDILTAMMSTLKKALYSGNETMADAIDTLKLFINLAGMKPTFLRKQIVEMVKTILLMADDHSLEKGTRRLAIEFVLTLLQFVLTLAEVEKTNPGLLELGMEFEINMEEMWDDNEETDNYGSGEFCRRYGPTRLKSRLVGAQFNFRIPDRLTKKKNNYGPWQGCRLSILLYRNNISTVALNVLPAYLAAPKGQKHHAALIALSKSINQWKCQECLLKEKEWDVRVAALGAAINFFPCPDLLTSMLSMLEKVLEDRDEAMAGEVLEVFIQLVEPRFLVGQIGEWVKRMWQIANNDSLNVGTRCLAVEFLSKLAQVEEIAPWLQQNVRELFEILMNMWDYINYDDPKADHVHAWESSNNTFWRKCWDMLLIAMGGNGIFYVALEVLPAYLNDLEWQKKHAAFIVLTQSIKSCGEVTIENLEKVVSMVLSTFPNANRHVRHAAVEAIRQLARHFSFGFGLRKEVMRTNIEQVIPILLSLFQDDDPVIQNASIHAIGELASTLGEHLQVRCDLMLPALAKVMNDSPNQDMRVNAASIILDFSKYCTRDNLREHCNGIISSCLIVSKEVKKFVMRIRWTELEMPSPHAMRDMLSWHDMFSCHDRMLSLEWFQLWTNEERDFSPYLKILMFPVFCAAAQLDPDVTRYDAVIMEKARACLVLCLCVDELTELLVLEIDRVVDTLIPFLKWYHDPPVAADALVPSVVDALVPSAKLIRKAAASAITKILNSARDVVEFSDPEDYDHLKQDVEKLSDKVKHALKEASDALSLAARRPHAHSRTTTPTGSTRKNSDEGCPGGIDILNPIT